MKKKTQNQGNLFFFSFWSACATFNFGIVVVVVVVVVVVLLGIKLTQKNQTVHLVSKDSVLKKHQAQ